jgi:hypothetical protein
MCFKQINVRQLASEKVFEWKRTSKRQEPYIYELAIMISDVPKKYQSELVDEIFKHIRNS